MIKRELTPKTFQEWLKLAMIPLLGLVLAVVLCWPTKQSDAVVATTSIASDASNRLPVKQLKLTRRKWPTARLEEVVAFNPFEPSQPLVSVDVAAQSTAPSEKGSTHESHSQRPTIGTLQAIYRDSQGAAAILDSKVVRVGDVLPSGERIVEITSQGIKLEGS